MSFEKTYFVRMFTQMIFIENLLGIKHDVKNLKLKIIPINKRT